MLERDNLMQEKPLLRVGQITKLLDPGTAEVAGMYAEINNPNPCQ